MESVDQIRYRNLLKLRRQFPDLNNSAFAQKLSLSASYFSRILNRNTDKRKTIGSSLARKIETAFAKKEGWLDNPLQKTEGFVLIKLGGALEISELITFLRGLKIVSEVTAILGSYDLLLKVEADDLEDLQSTILTDIRNKAEISDTQTFLAIPDERKQN